MTLDFYSTEELVSAKKQLLSDISEFKTELSLPHIPHRRDGEGCAAKVIDDIITIFTCLEYKLKLCSLPKYVADGPDVMPSARLYEGDMLTLMNLVRKLNDKLEETRSSLSTTVGELQSVNKQVKVLSTSGVRSIAGDLVSVPSVQFPAPGLSGEETETKSRNSQHQCGQTGEIQPHSAHGQSGPLQSWAAAAAAVSTPAPVLYNRFAPLRSTDGDDGDQDEPFT